MGTHAVPMLCIVRVKSNSVNSFPIAPKGQARIRTQVSAAHTHQDLDFAVEKFAEVSKELGLPVPIIPLFKGVA